MRWTGRRQSDNIEDRRGGGGGFGGGGMRTPIRAGRGGGLGLVGLIIVGAVLWFGFGVNPMFLFGMDGGSQTQQSQTASGPGVQGTSDKTDDFVATVLADTEDVWTKRFADAGEQYPAPTLVLFNNSIASACGNASSASGPFYCPSDQKLYIDLSFFRQLKDQLNAGGDFAQAYVVAHEVGHHIQNITGILPAFDQARRGVGEAEANALSVRIELQADCYAGIWAHDTQAAGYVEAGDIDEALNAAEQIGDDTLQKASQGYVVPDSFNHGTSAQRQTWFRRGFEEGSVAACDTSQGDI
ncbi:KPN_02809 family neutral zinc metallopeptidase [Aureimonas glaciei]|uniref:Flagellar biosynthesis protein FlgM n=1 Tax=Aureimonas glaciei TaxID=1776957 RepID=A0A916XTN3_9HYPH|nr:neutral zinc metallopeptidase [Aureimonas glaciei]GGD07881.1 flagellar biosynthesis protein FlgM [Aureimonas glaciei]